MIENFQEFLANRDARTKLQEHYMYRILDGMDIGELYQLASERLEEQLDEMDDEQLIDEVKHFYPDLLENQ